MKYDQDQKYINSCSAKDNGEGKGSSELSEIVKEQRKV